MTAQLLMLKEIGVQMVCRNVNNLFEFLATL